jgi:hypothetical protein
MFTRAGSKQSISPHPLSPRFILILSTHLCLCLLSGLFPYGFPTKILHAFLICQFLLLHPPWLDHSHYTWRRVQVMKLLMEFSPTSYHFISLQSNVLLRTLFLNTLSLHKYYVSGHYPLSCFYLKHNVSKTQICLPSSGKTYSDGPNR